MPKIKFSDDYPKLNDKEFHTFRGYSPQKHRYYLSQVDELFDIELKGEVGGQARLSHIGFQWASDVDPDTIKKDTFPTYTKDDWYNLMFKFYGVDNPFGIWLYFKREGD